MAARSPPGESTPSRVPPQDSERSRGNETGWAAAPTPSNPGSRSATAASSSEHSGLSWSNTSAPKVSRLSLSRVNQCGQLRKGDGVKLGPATRMHSGRHLGRRGAAPMGGRRDPCGGRASSALFSFTAILRRQGGHRPGRIYGRERCHDQATDIAGPLLDTRPGDACALWILRGARRGSDPGRGARSPCRTGALPASETEAAGESTATTVTKRVRRTTPAPATTTTTERRPRPRRRLRSQR